MSRGQLSRLRRLEARWPPAEDGDEHDPLLASMTPAEHARVEALMAAGLERAVAADGAVAGLTGRRLTAAWLARLTDRELDELEAIYRVAEQRRVGQGLGGAKPGG